ncbi:OLC1v1018733C1 [Oldenlandia corymbosa var. corymbosa]|uniref:OLC1v1018733C1 n=1 Tax=Oldenlandia corymbosa var. corymbosa TaxID=529605 RepID=A0AAV1ECF6_OLDCO|nr:OLC1v1018733C1 [Oldenlandia corymbosa var. corymbosa]
MDGEQGFQPMNVDVPLGDDGDNDDGDAGNDDEGDDDYQNENLDNGGQEDIDIGEGIAGNQHDGPPPGEHGTPHENGFHNGSSHSSPPSTRIRGDSPTNVLSCDFSYSSSTNDIVVVDEPEMIMHHSQIGPSNAILGDSDSQIGETSLLMNRGEEEDGDQSVEQVKETASQERLTEIIDNTEEMFQLEEQASQYFSRLYMAGEKINQVEENIILKWPLMLDPTKQTHQDGKLLQMKGKEDSHSSGPRTELNHIHTQMFKRKGKSFQEKKYGRMHLAPLKQTQKHLSIHTPHEMHRTLDRLSRWKRAHEAD